MNKIFLSFFLLIGFYHISVQAEEQYIPLTEDQWYHFPYQDIPAHVVSYDNGIHIQVASSAGILLHVFSHPQRLKALSLNLKVTGGLNLDKGLQGEPGVDDFIFRIGLIYQGNQTLGRVEQMLAADWLRQLYQKLKPGTGISRIEFFNVYQDKQLKGKQRTHPKSPLITERFIFEHPDTGLIEISIDLDAKDSVLAIWLNSDGDDTLSHYQVTVKEITLTTD